MFAKMRSLLLVGVSFVLTGAVIGNAYYQKKQFYPSVVYITKSNPSMAVSASQLTTPMSTTKPPPPVFVF